VMSSGVAVPEVSLIAWPGAEIRPFPVFSLGLLGCRALESEFHRDSLHNRSAYLPQDRISPPGRCYCLKGRALFSGLILSAPGRW